MELETSTGLPVCPGVAVYTPDTGTRLALNLYASTASAGFPSPAEEYVECQLDLNDYMVRHPAATFFVRAAGDSMRPGGIFSGDLLVVDRSLTPSHGNVVVAVVDGQFTVKRFKHVGGCPCLSPDNAAYPPVPINGICEVRIWGVVTYVIHRP